MKAHAVKERPGPRELRPNTIGAPAEGRDDPRSRTALRVWLVGAAILTLAGALLVSRAGRPLEQGGDAYSDGNVFIAGKNFAARGFWRLRFLPVHSPLARGAPVDSFYTHYPPGPDLLNGGLRVLGLRSLSAFRLVAVGASLLSLTFWFLALRRLFGDAVALIGLFAYAFLFPFIWLGDSIHHYAYSDLVRLATFLLAVRAMESRRRVTETVLLCSLLFVQSILAFDFIMFSQIMLLGLGVSGLRGVGLRRLVLFASMPCIGFGSHLLQNVWALGSGPALDDMWNSLLHRAFSSGRFEFVRYTRLDMLERLVAYMRIQMGVGLGTLGILSAVGIATWAATAPEGKRALAGKVMGTLAAASAAWFVVMSHHAAEHPFVVRHLLPLTSAALALGLRGVVAIAAPRLRGLAMVVAGVAVVLLAGNALHAYRRDSDQRANVSRTFAVAYDYGFLIPERTIATNIGYPAPPALAALLWRPVRRAVDLPALEAAFGKGARVTCLISRYVDVDPELYSRLADGRMIAGNDRGAVVEITLE